MLTDAMAVVESSSSTAEGEYPEGTNLEEPSLISAPTPKAETLAS